MRGWLFGVALMLAGGPALAAVPDAPPSPMIDVLSAPATAKAPFAQTLHMGGAKFELETDSLADIVKLIGTGTLGHMGDAGSSYSWVCYSLPHARLWLSGGEGGDLDTVTAQVSEEAASASCPALPAAYRSVNLDGAIWLGVSEAAAVKRLGPAGKSATNWRAWHRKLAFKTDKVDEDDGLAVRIDGGKVVFLEGQRSRRY